ncbi:MAG: DUF1501 domain-containing protein [Nitrososphaerales archaeon]
MNRRDLLKYSALGLIGNNLVQASPTKGEKSCLLIYLHGGLSQMEAIACNPEQPTEYRSVTGEINCGDFYLGGSFEELAKRKDNIRVCRSFGHKDSNHSSAAGWVLNMVQNSQLNEGMPSTDPSYGAILNKEFGPRNKYGIPTYTKINKIEFGGGRRDGAGWLGEENAGFDVDEQNISSLRPNVDLPHFSSRMDLAKNLDKDRGGWANLREEAFDIISGNAADAFDLTKETAENQNRFKVGKSSFGKSLLMAKRLIERGSNLVNVANFGWDNHQRIEEKFKKDGPELDWGISLIIDALKEIGKLESTLIVITTEFGRTSRLNKHSDGTPRGRDHQSSLVPLIFAGATCDGTPIGTCNKLGEYPTSSPFSPQDLGWTIGNFFGIPKNVVYKDMAGRPHFPFKEESKDVLA